jgi:hypothetical protein
VDCTVKNISSTGAAVEVASSSGIPHELVLDVVTRSKQYCCYVVWRDTRRLGMMFNTGAQTDIVLDD